MFSPKRFGVKLMFRALASAQCHSLPSDKGLMLEVSAIRAKNKPYQSLLIDSRTAKLRPQNTVIL